MKWHPISRYLASGFIALAVIAAMAGRAQATDSVNSELSHVAGGAVVAGVATYIADDFWPQDRGWVGFSVSAALGVVLEGVDAAKGNGFSALDAVSTALGAAAGAFVTDRYILKPAVRSDRAQGAYLGVKGEFKF